jgi:UPF0755 protein
MWRALLSLLVAALILAGYGYFYFVSPSALPEERTVQLPTGSGFRLSVDMLAEQGVITQPVMFKVVAALTGDARRIKAGEYRFAAHISPQDVLRKMVAGEVVVHKLTIAEGLNLRQIREVVMQETSLGGAFPDDVKEGELLPQTYHFVYGDTRAQLVARMRTAMRDALAELWAKRAEGLPFSTPQEALVLASLVEKETGIAPERARVAGVFVNRLRVGMRLQCDPTIIYGIEQKTGTAMERTLTRTDVETHTPWNTYTIDGLPPTPIASPGRAALEATLNPQPTDELYFVATGNGGHAFARTLSEHNRNVAAYRAALAAGR